MDTPVLSSSTNLRSLTDQNNWRVGLLKENDIKEEGKEAQNGYQPMDKVSGSAKYLRRDRRSPFSPAPAEIALNYKPTDEWGKERAGKDGHGKDCESQATSLVVKHIREDGGDNS